MSDEKTHSLVQECKRQEESCLYTSAGLYIWQKRSRFWKNVFVIAPIVIGGLASSKLLTGSDQDWVSYLAAAMALLAGFFPAIYKALGMDMRVNEIGQAASEFTNLRDRFRQLAEIKSQSNFEEFEAAFEQVMDRMDAARKNAPPMPEWCFEQARGKIRKGDYSFDADEAKTGK